jgi:omega-hydroxy-beta-dihydromenaquinone-9 sulfotransferase
MLFKVKELGVLSSLLRFYIFFISVFNTELRSNDFLMSLKRTFVLTLLLFAVPTLIIWNHVGFLLDDVLFPDWNRQVVERPLFIVGNARSGTTWLHRLIALDDDTFTSFRTWEIIFAPSVTWRLAAVMLFHIDQCYLFGLHYNLLCTVERYFFSGITVHQVGLQQFEEDEWLMVHVFFSQLIMLFFPLGGSVLYPLVLFDTADSENLPEDIREQIFLYYKQCVQRHLYAHSFVLRKKKNNLPNGPRIFLSKNPPFTMRLELLYRTFPDCRVACLLRDPVQSIPSMISYIAQVAWRIR